MVEMERTSFSASFSAPLALSWEILKVFQDPLAYNLINPGPEDLCLWQL